MLHCTDAEKNFFEGLTGKSVVGLIKIGLDSSNAGIVHGSTVTFLAKRGLVDQIQRAHKNGNPSGRLIIVSAQVTDKGAKTIAYWAVRAFEAVAADPSNRHLDDVLETLELA